jgi:hypothetical protein
MRRFRLSWFSAANPHHHKPIYRDPELSMAYVLRRLNVRGKFL